MEEKQNDLIIIKQLPIIEENLKRISLEIDKKIETVNALIVNEDTVKEVKKLRAELNSEFNELETQRKTVKNKVMTPYEAFEVVYKECVSDKYKNADITLKTKIDDVESKLKLEKEIEVKEFFNEYLKANKIDFVSFENTNIKIGLSDSIKSLKESVKSFIDKINDDLKLIETQEYKTDILVEYKRTLNVSNAITETLDRVKRINEEKQKQQELVELKVKEAEVVAKVEEFVAPTVIEEVKLIPMAFRVFGTIEQLRTVKQFLISNNIQYESIKEGSVE